MRTPYALLLPLLPLLLFGAAAPARAVGIPTQDNLWYYEIGGADPVSVPANPLVSSPAIGGSARFGLGYSCGKFNPVVSVTNLLDKFRQDGDAMVRAMVAAAYNIAAALPALVLQRAAPDLYDLFQTFEVDAQRRVSLATKSCEQMEAEIARGKNPFDEWIQLAKADEWKVQMADPSLNGDGDIVVAKHKVDETMGDHGVPWIAGPHGAVDQEPIQPIHDTTAAGYNITQNRPRITDPSTPATGSHLADTWPTPEAAAQWAVDVLGDDIVKTCDNCRKRTRPGTGLLPKYNDMRVFVTEGLVDLVSGAKELSFENLNAQSAPGIGLSKRAIMAIRAMPANMQSIVVGRLAGEIAQARTIDRALLIRRLLLTGGRIPEVRAYKVASDRIDAAVKELEKDIANLLFETETRQKVVSNTLQVILARDQELRKETLARPAAAHLDANPVLNGRPVR